MLLIFILSRSASDRATFFFFNDTATTEIYTLSLHDALPIYQLRSQRFGARGSPGRASPHGAGRQIVLTRSEEHTSELQSHLNLVCRLLLEKKTILETVLAEVRYLSLRRALQYTSYHDTYPCR